MAELRRTIALSRCSEGLKKSCHQVTTGAIGAYTVLIAHTARSQQRSSGYLQGAG